MAKKKTKKSKMKIAILSLTSIFIIGYFCFTLVSYIYNYISLKNEKDTLNAELLTLQKQKDDIKSEIVKLNDPEYVARYAKEKFLYSTDGEYVIKLEEETKETSEIENENNNIFIIIGVSTLIVLGLVIINNKKITKKNIVSA